MADINEDILLSYACERDEFSYTEMLNHFVPKKCAKQTLLKYKKSLEDNGKIQKKISPFTRKPVYYVPNAIRKKIEAKKIFNKIAESAKPEELENLVAILQKEVERLRYREEFIFVSMSVYAGIDNMYSCINLYSNSNSTLGFRQSLKDYMREAREFNDRAAALMKTLDDAFKKGWITDSEREIFAHEYPEYVKAFTEYKKAIEEGKIKVYFIGQGEPRLENP